MKVTTSCASAASNDSSGHGSSSAGASCTPMSGNRSCSAATNGGEGSAADASAPRRTSSAVSAPVPAPTSSTRWPASIPAKSAKSGASRVEKRPMKLSYEVSETLNIVRSIHVDERRCIEIDDCHVEPDDRYAQC